MDDKQISAAVPGDAESASSAEVRKPIRGRGTLFQVAAVLLTVVSALAGTGLARWLRAPAVPQGDVEAADSLPSRVFNGWGKPDLVLVLTGQQHGYMLPCGCSRPQVGGLERRYNFLQKLKQAGWPYVALDLGDVPQFRGPAGLPNQQGMIKYFYSMHALKAMAYKAVGFGENEINLGLSNVLAEFALNDPEPPVVMSNLKDAELHFPGNQTQAGTSVTVSGVKIGVSSVVGPLTKERMKLLSNNAKDIQFEDVSKTLNKVTRQMKDRLVDLPVLLYQGPLTRNNQKIPPTEAIECATAFPQFPIVLCLCDEDEPPAIPETVTTATGSKTLVIRVGHKGKFVGVVGVFKTGNPASPYRFNYQRVEMTEDFLTPENKENGHPILELMERYTKDLKDKGYLEKYIQVQHQVQAMPEVKGLRNPGKPEYVGSEKCKKCHDHAYTVWKASKHSKAYDTLVKKQRPSNRQYDPECIVCHTVGFGMQSGYVNEKNTPNLKNVGCESCHGPSSLHAANPNNPEWKKRINWWKYLPKEKRKDAIDQSCQKCHDTDNDVTWTHGGFERKWGPEKIEHYTPKVEDE